MHTLWRPELEQIGAYVTGDFFKIELSQFGVEEAVKLNSNEGAYPPVPAAVEAMQAALEGLRQYPDRDGPALRAKLAGMFKLDPRNFVFGNGSGAILRLIGSVCFLPGDEVVIPWPSFPQYVTGVVMTGAECRKVPVQDGACDLEAMLAAVTPRTKAIFLCNPNNPTGSIFTRPALESFLSRVPEHVLVVLDDAYAEYVEDPDYPDGSRYIDGLVPVVALRSFSKIYGLAGLRVGYGIMNQQLAGMLERVREPFSVSQLAVVGAAASLDDQGEIARRRVENGQGLRYWRTACARLGLHHTPAEANFIFINTERDSRAVFKAMMRHGVLIRPGHVYDSPNHIRVTIGLPHENERAVGALEQALHEVEPALAPA